MLPFPISLEASSFPQVAQHSGQEETFCGKAKILQERSNYLKGPAASFLQFSRESELIHYENAAIFNFA
jgi:hypothetical protein